MIAGFQNALQVGSTAEFIQRFYQQAEDRMWIASMAGVVIDAAQAGDEVALELVQEAIEDLATMVATVGVQLMGSAPSGYPLALAGGILVNSPFLRNGVLKRLEEGGLAPAQVVVVPYPVAGTLQLASLEARLNGH